MVFVISASAKAKIGIKLRVCFFGTGTSQGIPVIACQCPVCQSDDPRDKRLRSSILIENNGLQWVIDCGPDFRQQMLNARVRHLDAVLLTHGHKDHTGGLDDVRSFNFLQKKAMPLYGSSEVLEDIRREFSYIFAENRYPGVPTLELIRIDQGTFHLQDTLIRALPVFHGKMPVFGFRIGDFSYITDASEIPEETIALLEGTDTLVLNALRKEKHPTHFNLEEAVEMAVRIGARSTYLTHIGHLMGLSKEVSEQLPPGVFLAYDGLEIRL
jgi:phosphoribosyl 1,2-cyclic phosphate phosphodiesterase